MRRLLFAGILGVAGMAAIGAIAVGAAWLVVAPGLPSIEALRDIRLQVPMRVYSRDGMVLAEFGEVRRMPVRYGDTPERMIQAVLAAEDDRFFEHPGVDYQGILRAVVNLIRTGEKSQGGSTITMQVARNFFLSSEKTYLRKVSEIFLALRIEHELDKEEILELYLNKIYLGNRAYGVASAAQTYYGAALQDLTLDQMAMIAGLPKAPSRSNPIADPERAVIRRNYVLRRMHDLGFISAAERDAAMQASDVARLHSLSTEVEADHMAEMVRLYVVGRYGEEAAYTSGFKVYTTLDSRLQQSAMRALRETLLEYDRRHGYRGVESHLDPATLEDAEALRAALAKVPANPVLIPAAVTTVEEREVEIAFVDGSRARIAWDGLSWARRQLDSDRRGPPPRSAADVLQVGDLIRVSTATDGWRLAQRPEAEGALISADPETGAIVALAGGFDFNRSHFNRVTQAQRQPGSVFKPFIYSAALEKGYTPASMINDAPVVFDDPALEDTWRPGNYSGEFFGPTRLRVALMNSRNLVSIRLLGAIGIRHAITHAGRFGFDSSSLPRDLSLALGSGAVTPLQVATGYAVFANGGFLVAPYFIEEIRDGSDAVVYSAAPDIICRECDADPSIAVAFDASVDAAKSYADAQSAEPPQLPRLARRAISPQNAYLMTSMMQDVITRGTGVRARQLGRSDLAGKTGTTNDLHDAWFAGYNSDLVTVTWLGFDQPRSLGNGETGSRAALPMWIHFTREALRGAPEHPLVRPPGLVTVRIDPETGLLADSDRKDGIFETFQAELVPQRRAEVRSVGTGTETGGASAEPLF
ncbi:MAG: penicillin-binding protein 1A [Gammaproteobacteria bacterium]|jgi:penicillin-binding protein 1A|nr:penicillin-binding protein 1A [Gammaproteobacteria bacterium]